MSSPRIRANKLKLTADGIIYEANILCEHLKKDTYTAEFKGEMEEVIAHSVIMVSAITECLVYGEIGQLNKMDATSRDFLTNLKHINLTIDSDG